MLRPLPLLIALLAVALCSRERAPAQREQLRIRGHVGAPGRAALPLAFVALAACGFRTAPALVDGGVDARVTPDPDAYQCAHIHLDAGGWGGACTGSGACHGATEFGWCIDGVCRPQCVQPLACLACEGTAIHTGGAGQCYCAP